MVRLAQELDKRGIDYLWFIFTDDTDKIPSKNVIYAKPRNDFAKIIPIADYLVQLSDTEACSYSINEALYQNIPVIVTPLPYLEEIGVRDNENAYIMRFDMENIQDIVDKIENRLKFNFTPLKDSYKNILKKSKSQYKGKMLVATQEYDDLQLKRHVKKGEPIICTKERANVLVKGGFARYE
jgi:hypothetical protein